MKQNTIFYKCIVCLSLLFFIGVPSCGEIQNGANSLEQKLEIVQFGKDPENGMFRLYMEKFMKVARQRYSDELKKDTSYEEKLRFFIETEEQNMHPYLIDEEFVYLERHANDAELREKLWKKYLVDSDGFFAELNKPVVMSWLLYSDKVSADIYREALERMTDGHIEQVRNQYANIAREGIVHKDYLDNLLERLYPLAGDHEELKKHPEKNSFYNVPSFHNFEEFVQKYEKKKAGK